MPPTKPKPKTLPQQTPAAIRHKGSLAEFLQDMAGTRRLSKQNDLALLAGSVAFFCLFSLLPFLILSFLSSRYLLGEEKTGEMLKQLGDVLEAMIPAMNSQIFHDLVSVLKHNAAGDVFNLALLCWSTYGLFTCLHAVFLRISAKGGRRDFFWSNLVSLGCFLVGMTSSTAFLFLSTNPNFLRGISSDALDAIPLSELRVLASFLSLSLVVASIVFVLKYMPNQKVSFMNAFRGSLLFVTLFLIGRVTYHGYLVYYRYMNEMTYGTFFTVLVMIAWIYYLVRIFLFSAQYTLFLQQKPESQRG